MQKPKIADDENCLGYWHLITDDTDFEDETYTSMAENSGKDLTENKNNLPNDQRLMVRKLYSVMPFYMQEQKMTNWCWAASSMSTLKFFRRECDALSFQTQCGLVEVIKGAPCADHNQGNNLNDPLTTVKVLRSHFFKNHSNEKSREDLNGWRPVLARIDWSNSNNEGHFAAIIGMYPQNDVETVVIADPWAGISTTSFKSFSTARLYPSNGIWDYGYYTKDTKEESE